MTNASDRAELSALASQLDELTERVVRVAAHYENTPDSVIATELFAGERALIGARRAIDRASAALD